MIDLMAPRYKVVADYPGCNVAVGHIFISDIGEYFDKYKANFKRIEWFEDRKPEEMPEYVGFSRWITSDGDMSEFNGEFEEVVKVKRHTLVAFDGKAFLPEYGNVIYYGMQWLPATLSQYESYKASLNDKTE